MAITALPTPPTRDDPDNFAARADTFLAALPTFVTQANALAVEVEADRAAVDGQTALVLPASSAALGAANYAGVWSSMSGSLAVPASVYHAGRFWILLTALANVAAEEPGVGGSWAPLVDDVGMLAYFPMTTAPVGFLKANGAAVSRTAYAALFARIGTLHGAGDGSTTFNLPDMRGEFVRGLDDGRGVDAARALGSAQAGQNASHTHTGTTGNQSADHTHSGTTSTNGDHNHGVPDQDQNAGYGGNFDSGGIEAVDRYVTTTTNGAHNHSFTSGGVSANHTHSFTTAASGGTEARPRNVAWLACIRY